MQTAESLLLRHSNKKFFLVHEWFHPCHVYHSTCLSSILPCLMSYSGALEYLVSACKFSIKPMAIRLWAVWDTVHDKRKLARFHNWNSRAVVAKFISVHYTDFSTGKKKRKERTNEKSRQGDKCAKCHQLKIKKSQENRTWNRISIGNNKLLCSEITMEHFIKYFKGGS